MGKTIRRNDPESMHRASAMALSKRHGRHSGQTHKDRRMPRGGNRNDFAGYMAEVEEDEAIREEVSHQVTDKRQLA